MAKDKKGAAAGKKRPRAEAEAFSESEGEVEATNNNEQIQEEEEETFNMPVVKKNVGSFQSLPLLPVLQKAIQKKGFKLLTPIQRKSIPPLLEGRDVVGMARTGSGKTAAFVLPLLQALKSHSLRVGVRGLILSPSRELAMQTAAVVKELSKFTDLRCVTLVGGDVLEEQFAQLATNPDIVIATPGRLMHICVETGLSLKEVSFVVWDEADRLMEDPTMAQQMKELCARLPEARQTALFSATLPKALAEFAQAGLRHPLLIRLDVESKLSPDLKLSCIHTQSESKDALLLLLLRKILFTKKNKDKPLTVIFVATKHHVEYLQELLTYCNIPCTYIYGALDQTARKMALESFRRGTKPVLVVTDVAARGIDVPLLDNVINYDFPPSAKLFVHRVGRVARAGRTGHAFSFVTPEEMAYLFDLQLFLGKTVKSATTSIEDLGENAIVLGGSPQYLLDEEQETLHNSLEISGTLSSLKGVMTNACKLYKKTRPTASPESHRRSKEFVVQNHSLGIHPVFTKLFGPDVHHQAALVSTLQNYKPAKGGHLQFSMPSMTKTMLIKKNTVLEEQKEKKSTRDEANYLKYTKEGTHDDVGYSIKAGATFAEQARAAVFDISATNNNGSMADDPALRRRKGDDSRKKMIRTDVGTKVPASFKADFYDKWRAKTHLGIQKPGEVEMEGATSRAKSMVAGSDERKKWRLHRSSNKDKKSNNTFRKRV